MSATAAAANFAYANRTCIANETIQFLSSNVGITRKNANFQLVYDVSHNVTKIEKHGNENKEYLIHRKGASRALGPHHPDLPSAYAPHGQPVFVGGGNMGTSSYLLVGTDLGSKTTFASTVHGFGCSMDKRESASTIQPETARRRLNEKGIFVCGPDRALQEVAPKC